MSEQQLKHIFLTNKKSFLEIFNKETEETLIITEAKLRSFADIAK